MLVRAPFGDASSDQTLNVIKGFLVGSLNASIATGAGGAGNQPPPAPPPNNNNLLLLIAGGVILYLLLNKDGADAGV